MQQQNNSHTFVFVGIVAAGAALLLAMTFKGLEKRINYNIEVDKKKNILSALGVTGDECNKDIITCYNSNIEGMVVNARGEIQQDVVADKINVTEELDKSDVNAQLYPLFVKKDKTSGEVVNYCVPIQGKGLWSTIYGYLALEKDLNTVSGITFYKHGETPGLGAEIETAEFRTNFIGKKILGKDGSLVSITIVKGKVKPDSTNKEHEVDGLSGATLTCEGVSAFLKKSLSMYQPYFNMIRKENR